MFVGLESDGKDPAGSGETWLVDAHGFWWISAAVLPTSAWSLQHNIYAWKWLKYTFLGKHIFKKK